MEFRSDEQIDAEPTKGSNDAYSNSHPECPNCYNLMNEIMELRMELGRLEETEKKSPKERKIGRIRRDDSGEQDGSRFRSTKAKGDMKKGNIQPYAYIRLDSRMLSKKKQNQSLGKFNNLIGAAKKGAREGSAKRRKQN